MKESACQRELSLMLDKKELAWVLMDMCHGCFCTIADRPGICRKCECFVGVALEKAGYTIPLRRE